MKRLIPFTLLCLLLVSSFSCKKMIEQKKQDALMDAITNGKWIVEQYLEGATNVTGDFEDYDFQFFKNGTVTGFNTGGSTDGTWAGDIDNYSITSQFPSGIEPLKKLNGVWKIKDSYWDYVEAEMNTPSGKNILHLRKKP